MRTLLHMPLDPASRMVRLALAEKGLPVRLNETPPWREDSGLLEHNPAGRVPVLLDEPPTGGEIAVTPGPVIIEYLEEAYRTAALLPGTSAGRAEMRRLIHWFDDKFEEDVNQRILRRKIDDKLQGRRRSESEHYRAGAEALAWHLDYIAWLLEGRDWLAGEKLTAADLAGAAHLSVNDYIGAIPCADFPTVKEWYQRIKCRPSFRPLLADRVEGLPPPAHYDDLDF